MLVENLSSSLVREFLSRKGLKDTLSKLDDELPRTSESISNRVTLAKAVKIEKLMKQNKELPNPYRSMIEVIVDYLISAHPQAKRSTTSAYNLTSTTSQTHTDSNPITFSPTHSDVASSHDKEDSILTNLSNIPSPPRDYSKRDSFRTASPSSVVSGDSQLSKYLTGLNASSMLSGDTSHDDAKHRIGPKLFRNLPSRSSGGDSKYQTGPSSRSSSGSISPSRQSGADDRIVTYQAGLSTLGVTSGDDHTLGTKLGVGSPGNVSPPILSGGDSKTSKYLTLGASSVTSTDTSREDAKHTQGVRQGSISPPILSGGDTKTSKFQTLATSSMTSGDTSLDDTKHAPRARLGSLGAMSPPILSVGDTQTPKYPGLSTLGASNLTSSDRSHDDTKHTPEARLGSLGAVPPPILSGGDTKTSKNQASLLSLGAMSSDRSHDDMSDSGTASPSLLSGDAKTSKYQAGLSALGMRSVDSRYEDKKLLSRGTKLGSGSGGVLPSATPGVSSADSSLDDLKHTKGGGSGMSGPASTGVMKTAKHGIKKPYGYGVIMGSNVKFMAKPGRTKGERSNLLSSGQMKGNPPLSSLDPSRRPNISVSPSSLEDNQSSLSSQATPLPPSTTSSLVSVASSLSTTGNPDNVMLFEDLEDFDLNVDLPKPTAKSLHGGGRLGRVSFPPKKSIAPLEAKRLRQILFGDSTTGFNEEWTQQELIFSDRPKLEYGLIQRKGGPCGTLAALQAHIIKHLLFDGQDEADIAKRLRPSAEARQKALVASIAEILWRAGSSQSAVVALCSQGNRGDTSRTTSYRQTDVIDQFSLVSLEDKHILREFIQEHFEMLMEEHGCIIFTASVIFSRGISNEKALILSRVVSLCPRINLAKIQSDMDEPSSHLIGAHGYCTQELVNLILTGRATSNVFDGVVSLDSGSHEKSLLKGIGERSDIGFLSLFEHYKSCEVGEHYKNPRYPVYVVCSESHFLVLFGTNKAITDPRRSSVEKEFDLYYYDGLANQQDEIRLTIRVNAKTRDDANDLIPPIEHCIRTRWKHSLVDWNGVDQLL